MWTLDEALSLIRDLQPEVLRLGYHITLAGGVLNKGVSEKDLDLIFLPFNEENSRPYDLMNLCLRPLLGDWRAIRDSPDYMANDNYHYVEMVAFSYLGKRIDAFIL